MGIGNRRHRPHGLAAPDNLITPHGDREPSRSTPTRTSPRSSHYPSWGSGTRGHPLPVQPVLLLITPHGDRERHKHAVDQRGVSAPHYPSWGSGTTGTDPDGNEWSVTSLPLMGIGNRGNVVEPRRGRKRLITPHGDRERGSMRERAPIRSCSLPLMGIGNSTRRSGCRAGRTAPHYPSWGSGTEPDPRRRLDALEPLITPHGDRERLGVVPERAPEIALITPHGDREPPEQKSTETSARISLPLMRIGNGAIRPILPQYFGSHYPSWGSGTTRASRPASLATATHYPSWGSGTVNFGDQHPVGIHLITPHGDREPDTAEVIDLKIRLITPHGDREHPCGSR